MVKSKEVTDKILFWLMFSVILFIILIVWAKCTRDIVKIPLPVNSFTGYVLLATGVIFVCSGILDIRRSGNRLSIKHFSPKGLLKRGIYDLIRYPIFSGAALISFGLSAVSRSSSGFWLVSPVFTLLMIIYVARLNNEKTEPVSGLQDYKPFLSLPADSVTEPSSGERFSSYFLTFVPWLIIYKAFIFIGAPDETIITNLPFEKYIPIWEFSTVFYSFAFLFSLAVPLVLKTRQQLNHFIKDVWFATIFVGIIFLLFPLIIDQKEFIPHSFAGRIILYERSIDGESGALPSGHVIWAFLAANYFSRSFVSLKWIWLGLAVLISMSCLTVGAHSLPDIVAGFCAYIIIVKRQEIWNYLQLWTERFRTRREWSIGPYLLINRGFYAGAAGFAGTLVTGFFLGRQNAIAGFLIMMAVITGVRILMQVVEGSQQSLRFILNFGGLMIGIFACILVSLFFSIDIFIMLGSLSMAAPWISSTGRPGSMVKDSGSNGNIPATLFSIGVNIITGLVLIRLYNIGVSSSFIVGIYFILTGIAVFAEESFQGDIAMLKVAGVKISQLVAIIYFLSGIIFTSIPEKAILVFQPNVLSIMLAIITGIVAAIVLGTDARNPLTAKHTK